MTREDLLKFCAGDRVNLSEPWTAGDYSYASNGHIIIRVPRIASLPENPGAPSVANIFLCAEPAKWFRLAEINLPEKVMGECSDCRGFGKDFECEECDGTGAIKIGKYRLATVDCPDCDGDGHIEKCDTCDSTGKIETIQHVAVGVAHYQRKHLTMLADLPNCEIGPIPDEKPAPFRFDGGDGALMPMRLEGRWEVVK